MIFNRFFPSSQSSSSSSNEPTKLPDYFPIQPRYCEKQSEKLFTCITNQATSKARDMELAGLHTSYYEDIQNVKAGDEDAAKKVRELASAAAASELANNKKDNNDNSSSLDLLPKAGDNPLDECKKFIYYYKKCCDRELKKKHNWILTEPYRVQEEYRYQK